ncbi:MAG TPA: phytoene/squalene synthase family protein [Ignavibacteria bacterium]|nr:phytoene/squalene synthase family protein [Ignavibacteria bacterium]
MNLETGKYSPENKEKEITKQSKSNFLYSFSLLSKEKNDAINTVYAFCRKTDDIVDDENESIEKKYSRIIEWRSELEKALISGDSKYSLLNNVNIIIKKFNIPVEPFFDLIKGMEMDLKKNRYNTFTELMDYCFHVASTVGLMSIEIFGYNNPRTKDFAINLGIALQLTNILRDIKTDAQQGRIYIPLEDLRRFNYSENDLLSFSYNDEFIKLMKHECERAKFFYEQANSSLTKEDKGLMFAARIMEHIYFRVLKKIEKRNYNVFEKKVRVSNLKKIIITAGVYAKYRLLYSFDENRLALNGK